MLRMYTSLVAFLLRQLHSFVKRVDIAMTLDDVDHFEPVIDGAKQNHIPPKRKAADIGTKFEPNAPEVPGSAASSRHFVRKAATNRRPTMRLLLSRVI